MANRRRVYERHLTSFKNALTVRTDVLKAKKLDEKAQKKDPTFRNIKGKIRQFERRLRAIDKLQAINAEVEARRAERLANPKVKEKKPKAAPAAKPKKEKKSAG
jgi:hypothetical protein